MDFRKDGRRFRIAPKGAGWTWSVSDMDGREEAGGQAPSRAVAAAHIVKATLARVDWPMETGMTGGAA
jgi:hypothetical protein